MISRFNKIFRITLIVIICCSLIIPSIGQFESGQATEPYKETDNPDTITSGASRNILPNNGHGLVAPKSNIGPSKVMTKGTSEWDDAKFDVVNVGNKDYFTVLTKINGSYLHVGVILNPDYTKKVENGDYCALVFDKTHDGGSAPQIDDWYVECRVQTTGFTKVAKIGDGTKWINAPWPMDWEVEVFDLSEIMQVYRFKINVTSIFKCVPGNMIGFGVKVVEKGPSDSVYWPDQLNPGYSPEDLPRSWGHLFYYRPTLVVNKVKSNNIDGKEWLELYNNCSTEIKIHNVYITDQDNNYSVLPNTTIPAYGYLILKTGSSGDDSGFSGKNEVVYIGGTNWWDDLGDDVSLKFGGNGCTLDYMQYGEGPEIDQHPNDPTTTSDWRKDGSSLPAPSVIQYLSRIRNGQDTNSTVDWEIIKIKTRPLDHIALSPMFEFPIAKSIRVKNTIKGYLAIGWNNAEESEKNYTWTPTWSTSDNLGELRNHGGNADNGYTIEYAALLVPGYDNITITNESTGIFNSSCIKIFGNPLDHITLIPTFGYSSPRTVVVGETLVGYTALGWNDEVEAEKNLTWHPVWNTTNGLGSLVNFQGSAKSGYTIEYAAGNLPGHDNITVTDRWVDQDNCSCIKIVPDDPDQISIVTGNNQIGTAGTQLANSFVIEVQDLHGNPAGEGIEVWFNITTPDLNGDGSLSSVNPLLTDEYGRVNTTLTLDTKPGLNSVTATINGTGISLVTFTATGTLPQVSPYLIANVTSVVAAQKFNYFLHYYILGSEPATDVWINDSIPSSINYVSDTSGITPMVTGRNYSWHFTSLDAGAHSFILECEVNSEIENGTIITNYFTVDYSDQFGKIQLSETSNTVTITIYSEPVLNSLPVIKDVPDLVVRYDWDYEIDLSPYITDADNDVDDLFLFFSDTHNIRIDPVDKLTMILNYSISYVGTTQSLTITVSDGIGSDWDLINVQITDNFPPEVTNKIPDVNLKEDSVCYPFNITHYFYDKDGETTYYIIDTNNINVTYLENFSIRIKPVPNWYGVEQVTFRAIDDTDAFVEDSIFINVQPVNDAPEIFVIENQSGTINNAWILDLNPYLRDIDNGLSELTVSTDSEYVIVNGLNLTFRYSEAVGTDIVTVTVSDGDEIAYRQIYIQIEEPSTSASTDEMFNWIIIIMIIFFIGLAAFMAYKGRKPLVEDVFLIYKDGTMLAHSTRRIVPDLDTDLFSGMLTAIQDFVKDSFKDEKETGLSRLEFGKNKLCIERTKSGNIFIVLVYTSEGNDKKLSKIASDVLKEVENEFGDVLKNWSGKMNDIRGVKDILSHTFQR